MWWNIMMESQVGTWHAGMFWDGFQVVGCTFSDLGGFILINHIKEHNTYRQQALNGGPGESDGKMGQEEVWNAEKDAHYCNGSNQIGVFLRLFFSLW